MPDIIPERTYHLDRRAVRLAGQGEAVGNADDLLTTQEVADWFQCAKVSLDVMRGHGTGPPFIYVTSGMVRYRRDAVVEWLRNRETIHINATGRHRGHGGLGRPRGSKVINGKLVLAEELAARGLTPRDRGTPPNTGPPPDCGSPPGADRPRIFIQRPQR